MESPRRSSGGLAFSVTIEEARSPVPKRIETETETAKANLSLNELSNKLDDAAERRNQMLEKQRAALQSRLAKVAQIHKQLAAELHAQSSQLAQDMAERLDAADQRRQQHLESIAAKLREHDEHAAQVREVRSQDAVETESETMTKLDAAAEKREELLRALLDRLNEKHLRVEEVRLRHRSAQLEKPLEEEGPPDDGRFSVEAKENNPLC